MWAISELCLFPWEGEEVAATAKEYSVCYKQRVGIPGPAVQLHHAVQLACPLDSGHVLAKIYPPCCGPSCSLAPRRQLCLLPLSPMQLTSWALAGAG